MARTMRKEARQGMTLPWVVTYGGRFAGQLTVGSIVGARPDPRRSATGSTRLCRPGRHSDRAGPGH